MPRSPQSLETRIVQHFNSAPIGEATLLHRLIGENLKVRKGAEDDTEAEPRRPAAPARSRSRSNAGTKKKSSKKKQSHKVHKEGGRTRNGGQQAPKDDEIPE